MSNLSSLRFVFMGTPEFAVPSLDGLLQAGCPIVSVITAPDKPADRGMKIRESAVKKFSIARGLPVLQPPNLKNPEFLKVLAALQADMQVIVAFRMLPEAIWKMPAYGTINLHASLLPAYRGAAPLNWAIINGEKETGLTTFKLQQVIDTGNILMQERLSIGEDESAGELHDRMKVMGARLLVTTVQGLAAGKLKEIPQQNQGTQLPTAPKITMETCRIDWNRPMDRIHDLIRGLSPAPGAFSTLDGKILKIFRSQKVPGTASNSPGTYETDKKTFLKFACIDGYIDARELQLEGKKKLAVQDFLRGYRFA